MRFSISSTLLFKVDISVLISLILLDSDVVFVSNLLIFFLLSSIVDNLFLITSREFVKFAISCLIGSKLTESIFILDMRFSISNILSLNEAISVLISLTLLDIDVVFDSNLPIFFLLSSILGNLILITSREFAKSIISCLIGSKLTESIFILDMLFSISSTLLFKVDISVLISLTLLVNDVVFDSNLLMLFLLSLITDNFSVTVSRVLDKSIISCLIGSKSTDSIFIPDTTLASSMISNFIADISFLFVLISFAKLVFILFSLSFRLLTSTFIFVVAVSTSAILLEIIFKESLLPSTSVVIFFISV